MIIKDGFSITPSRFCISWYWFLTNRKEVNEEILRFNCTYYQDYAHLILAVRYHGQHRDLSA